MLPNHLTRAYDPRRLNGRKARHVAAARIAAMDEQYRDVVGYETWYEVSDQAQVRSLTREMQGKLRPILREGKVLTPSIDKTGHPYVGLRKDGEPWKTHRVARLVLEAFVGPRPDGMDAVYLDGDPGDCRLSNLSWGVVTGGPERPHEA